METTSIKVTLGAIMTLDTIKSISIIVTLGTTLTLGTLGHFTDNVP